MGPALDQAAALISEMRGLDLECALLRRGPAAKNSRISPVRSATRGPPRLLQIALLHRRQRAIADHDAGFEAFDEARDLLDLAFGEIGCGMQRAEHDDTGLRDVEIDGASKPNGLVELLLRTTNSRCCVRRTAPQYRLNYECATGR